MTGPPITTVVFDADETLVDLSPAVTGALGVVLAEMRRLTPAAEALTVADLAGGVTAATRDPEGRAAPR